MNQTNTKVICYPERQTAITISVPSHWLNHLFFSGATAIENTFNLHVHEMRKRVLTVENILIHVSLTRCLNRLSHAGSLCCPGRQKQRCFHFFFSSQNGFHGNNLIIILQFYCNAFPTQSSLEISEFPSFHQKHNFFSLQLALLDYWSFHLNAVLQIPV